MKPIKPDLTEMFGKHLVALALLFSTTSGELATPPILKAYSGTLIWIARRLFYLTAGHILAGIDKLVESGTARIEKAFLADIFGLGRITDNSIPFEYTEAPRMHVDDRGLDFGLIALRRYYQGLLLANGITPIREAAWKNVPDHGFDSYLMFGLPDELMIKDVSQEPKLRLSPALIKVERINQPPPGLATGGVERFYGRIAGEIPIGSISGMSGGPIFGIRLGSPIRYWIVAIQSSWLPESKVIAAVPIKTIASMMNDWIEENDPERRR